jgi:cyclic pyranopterin phosphate synthase
MAKTSQLTHLDDSGAANMVDVSAKGITVRTARAAGSIRMASETLALIKSGQAKKGDVLGTARLAGIMAAKETSRLIPLCHPLALTKVSVEFTYNDGLPGIEATSFAKVSGQTGVEMEALTAVTVALLTIYDMAKAADKSMEVGAISLREKTGGASGDYQANN